VPALISAMQRAAPGEGGSTGTAGPGGGPLSHSQIFLKKTPRPNDYTDCHIKFFQINFFCWFGHGRLSLEVGEDG